MFLFQCSRDLDGFFYLFYLDFSLSLNMFILLQLKRPLAPPISGHVDETRLTYKHVVNLYFCISFFWEEAGHVLMRLELIAVESSKLLPQTSIMALPKVSSFSSLGANSWPNNE